MEEKRKLKGGKIWITEDLTWGERKMKWRMRGIAREEIGKGSRVWMGYDKMMINDHWWFWDVGRETLVDGKGRERGGEEREAGLSGNA